MLDFAEAAKVFAGDHFTAPDDRRDYGEVRYITAGWLDGRFVVLCGHSVTTVGGSFR